MKRILLAIPLAFLAGIGACSSQNQETGKAEVKPAEVDCHVLVIESRDTIWVKAASGDTLFSTLRPDSAISMDTIRHPKQPKPDLTACLLSDTIRKP